MRLTILNVGHQQIIPMENYAEMNFLRMLALGKYFDKMRKDKIIWYSYWMPFHFSFESAVVVVVLVPTVNNSKCTIWLI